MERATRIGEGGNTHGVRIFASSPWRAIPELDGLGNDDGARMLRRAYMRAAVIWKILPPMVLVLSGFGALTAISWASRRFGNVEIFHDPVYVSALYICIPTGVMSLAYVLVRRTIEVALLRREMTGPVCPKCKSSLIGLRIETRGAEPDPAQNRVRCPECGRIWRMLDIGLTPRDLMPREFDIASAGMRLPPRHE